MSRHKHNTARLIDSYGPCTNIWRKYMNLITMQEFMSISLQKYMKLLALNQEVWE